MEGSTTSSAPRPMPARKRKADTDHGPHASAVTAVNDAYQRIAPTKMRRRPIRSASRPKTTLPTREPASAEAVIQPARLPESPQMEVKSGTVKPTRRISIATNVQAKPVTATARRWKRVKPPFRRTSSTSTRLVVGSWASTTAICANLSLGLRL